MVMGANIGTSMTSTLVALTQVADANEFERAFSAATVHDCFNWSSVLVFLVLELVTKNVFGAGYLESLTTQIVGSQNTTDGSGKDLNIPDVLGAITDPFTESIVQVHDWEGPFKMSSVKKSKIMFADQWYTIKSLEH